MEEVRSLLGDPPVTAPNPEAAAFIEKLFLGIAAVGFLGIILITVRSSFYGLKTANLAQILMYVAFLGMVAFRKRMTTFQVVFVSIGVCWAFSFLTIYSWGLASQGFLILTVAFTTCAVYFGRTGVSILSFFAFCFFLVIVQKFLRGEGVGSLDIVGFSNSWIGWGLEAFGLVAVIGFLSLLLQEYSQSLRRRIQLLKEKEKALENEERLRAETLRKQDIVLKEREALVQEVSSRVQNNLHVISSLIQYQALSVHDREGRDILMDLKSRIYAFSLLHKETVQKDGEQAVNFSHFVGTIARVLAISFRPEKIRIEPPEKNTFLPFDTALPCSVAAYEALSIMVRNLRPLEEGEQRIKLFFDRIETGSFVFRIEAPGADLKKAVKQENTAFATIRHICELLNADYQFSTADGVRFEMVFQEYHEAGAQLF